MFETIAYIIVSLVMLSTHNYEGSIAISLFYIALCKLQGGLSDD